MIGDEGFTWRLIDYGWLEMVCRTSVDVHPPMYYIAVKGWSYLFGDSLMALRGFSCVLSVASIVLTYGIARLFWRAGGQQRDTSGQFAGLIAAAGVAFHPGQVELGSTARMYPLGVFLALLATCLLLKIRTASRLTWSASLLFVTIATALCYTHNFGLLAVLSQAGYCILSALRHPHAIGQHHGRVLSTFALVALLYAPWAVTLTEQTSTIVAGYWIKPLTLSRCCELVGSWTLGIEDPSLSEWAFAVGMLILVVMWSRRSSHKTQLLFESFAPWIAVCFFAAVTGRSLALVRCFAFAQASLFVLLGGIASIRGTVAKTVVGCSFLVPVMLNAVEQSTAPHLPASYDEIAAIILQKATDTDVTVVSWRGAVNVLRYHLEKVGVEQPDVRALEVVFQEGPPHRVHMASLDKNEVLTSVESISKQSRIWRVGHGFLPRTLPGGWQREQYWNLDDGTCLGLYAAPERVGAGGAPRSIARISPK